MDPIPREGALHGLTTLRSQAVEQARAVLGQVERERAAAVHADRAAREARLVGEGALRKARSEFSGASSIQSLRLAEACLALHKARLGQLEQRVARTTLRLRAVEAEWAARAAELRAAELARRAVARTVAQRAAAVSLRTERRREEEVEDNFRAAESTRGRPVSSIS